MTRSLPSGLFLALIAALSGTAANAQDFVCAETNLGEFCMTLYPEEAPNTVANFLDYVNDGDYDGAIIHPAANSNLSCREAAVPTHR